jgi:DNA (cytosine-5)-methyltransferase 1
LQGNGIDRKPENGCAGKGYIEGGPCYTLNTVDRPAVAFGDDGVIAGSFLDKQGEKAGNIGYSEETAPSLTTDRPPAVVIENQPPATFPWQQGFIQGEMPMSENMCSTLIKNQVPAVLINNHPADSRVTLDDSGKAHTLTARMGTGGGNTPMVMESETVDAPFTVNYDASAEELKGKAPCLYSTDGINGKTFVAKCPQEDISSPDDPPITATCGNFTQICHNQASTLMARDYKDPQIVTNPRCVVRRLCPTECSRLQGYNDEWCIEGVNGPVSDSAQYAAIGNSVALPCVDYVISGIADALVAQSL